MRTPLNCSTADLRPEFSCSKQYRAFANDLKPPECGGAGEGDWANRAETAETSPGVCGSALILEVSLLGSSAHLPRKVIISGIQPLQNPQVGCREAETAWLRFSIPPNPTVVIILWFGDRKLAAPLRAVLQGQSHLFLGCSEVVARLGHPRWGVPARWGMLHFYTEERSLGCLV